MESPLMRADALESTAPFLFLEAEIGAEKLEVTGEFSGERLLARRPEVYRAICRMSAEGLSMSAMARALGVSRNTVAAVQEREQF
ncbi:MAG: helix-turn-helix domain-containing protein, partial [Chthoniobacteraceae bacterium]|nr:helix-turn-helix domain-containing protein [Chthoniobacteraceae bacterium]